MHTCTSTHALGKNIVRSVDLSIIKVVCIEIDYVFCLSHLILETNNTPRRKTEIFYWQWKYLYYYSHSFRLTLPTFTIKSDSTQLTRRCFDVRNDIDACVFVCNKEISECLFVCIYLRLFCCAIFFNVRSHLLGLCFNFFFELVKKIVIKLPIFWQLHWNFYRWWNCRQLISIALNFQSDEIDFFFFLLFVFLNRI